MNRHILVQHILSKLVIVGFPTCDQYALEVTRVQRALLKGVELVVGEPSCQEVRNVT